MSELAALRAINYDWTMHLRSVWIDPPFDAPAIHGGLRLEFRDRLDRLCREQAAASPLGWLIVGSAGIGKTHWLSTCRREAVDRQMGFVLVDMTDVRDFWRTVLQGYLDSLQQEYEAGKDQQQVLLERFLGLVKFNFTTDELLQVLPKKRRERFPQALGTILQGIGQLYPRETKLHQDVIRAVLATTSHDAAISSAGLSWLNANPVDDEMRRLLGFTQACADPSRIVKGLSWMMHLCGPTVLALDQLDPIVAQLDPAADAAGRDATPEGQRALAIIQEIANGLGALRDVTCWTLTVVSCLEATLAALRKFGLASWGDRFEEARQLVAVSQSDAAASLIAPRVAAGCAAVGFKPPYATWPVASAALREIQGMSPRALLQACESHRRACLQAGRVTELTSMAKKAAQAPTVAAAADVGLDVRFEEYRRAADVAALLEESAEDERLAPLLLAGCRCLLHEIDLPPDVQAVVDDFHGGKTTRPLHARIRLIHLKENDREEHFCYRALERSHGNAFQARLRGIINGSGIDRRLPFRHCVVVRSRPMPGGKITQQLLDEYQASGGGWHEPTEEELRTLHALAELVAANPPGLEDWLRKRRPASHLPLFEASFLRHSGRLRPPDSTSGNSVQPLPSQTVPKRPVSSPRTPAVVLEKPSAASARPRVFPESLALGARQVGNRTELVAIPVRLLEKHSVVLAGAGSGKTTLLKRIVEEAALAGIPSIVIDSANDLAALGDRRQGLSVHAGPDDAAKARDYHDLSEVICWTPGRESGNPLVLEPLPDLSAVAGDPEELELAIQSARDALASLAISQKGAAAENKRGVLSRVLKYLAEHGGGNLRDLIALLSDLPADARIPIDKEAKLARELADSLKVRIETSPILRGVGSGLDPAVLFGDDGTSGSRVRISVINLIGLSSADVRQQFVYQLGMALFSWIKRNPHPPGRALRGLLVVDEAREFIPSVRSAPSKESLQLLASQARKYHLGLLIATQHPKEVENRVIANCATHWYGRASSPQSIAVIQDQLKARGGEGDDVATLKPGQFYFYNSEAGLDRPVRLTMPDCLSWHPPDPLDEAAILERAVRSRARREGD